MSDSVFVFFMISFYSMSPAEKTKDNEHVESHGDGSAAGLSVNSVSVESENHEVTDIEHLRRKSPDEVCVTWFDVVSQILRSKN